ncbi:MAG: rubrerythrin [Candidatus Improbicoccus pseudotrichonymphae]|uniref:Rubrerythrin n=1 Tax=Candidatus Improbicoccus pseudotrichonymphae TaxID=3033792 RepID=A0AA48I9U6_9FIRM|nr:MAG: rubrerythrin [Candidatus Improbicoccus pseudotrichonymphae]
MSVEFKNSITKHNLLRAFAGESQACNRYAFAASHVKKQNLHVIEAVFLFTANQEREHAKIYYKLLKEFAGENISIDGDYPVDIFPEAVQLLRKAHDNEYDEYENIYAGFAKVAEQEGFSKIASTFQMIAEVEKVHGDRFAYYADLINQDKLFVSDVKTKWMCLNCGYLFEGTAVPGTCPACDHDKGYFIRLELAPYFGFKI